MSTVACLVFGQGANPTAFFSPTMPVDTPPPAGGRVEMRFSGLRRTGNPIIVDATCAEHIAMDDGGLLVLLHCATEAEPDQVMALLAAGWDPVEDPTDALQRALLADPIAVVHHVFLLVGEPTAAVAPRFQVWQATFTPDQRRLPLFGQRMRINPVGAISTTVPAPDLNPALPGTVATGVVGVVVYSAMSAPGEATVMISVRDLGEIDGFMLTATGWSLLGSDRFDEDGFRAADRVLLAHRTRLDLDVAADGSVTVRDFELDDAASVPLGDYRLLPERLVDYCRVAVEIAALEDRLPGWERDLGAA